MSNSQMDKLDAEILAEEKLMYPDLFKDDPDVKQKEDQVDEDLVDPEEEEIPKDEEDVPEDLSDVEMEAEELVEDGSDEELEEEKPKRKSWKSEHAKLSGEHDQLNVRYNNLRSATDQDKHQSRTREASLLGRIEILETEITSLRNQVTTVNANKDIYADIFTEEDVDVLGEEAINAFKKASARSIEASLAPMKSQLEATRTQELESRKAAQAAVKQEAYGIFLTSLKRIVPEFDEINNDDGFKQFMSEVEPGSNKSRKEELGDAVTLGNPRWASTFFNNYKTLREEPSKKLDKKLMPNSSGASTVNVTDRTKVKTYPLAEYDRFMDKLIKGEYNKSKQLRETGEKLEAMYDRAYDEGRIV